MKRILLFSLLVFSALGLSATASYAGLTQPEMDPGCDVKVMNLLVDQSNAIRARQRAYEREIFNREPSTLFLTCYDQALQAEAKAERRGSGQHQCAVRGIRRRWREGGRDDPRIPAVVLIEQRLKFGVGLQDNSAGAGALLNQPCIADKLNRIAVALLAVNEERSPLDAFAIPARL